MKNTSANARFHRHSSAAGSPKKASGPLTWTAILLSGLALPAAAQPHSVGKVAAEKGFTVAPNVQTAIVIKVQPDAVCDLRAADVNDPMRSLKLYGNAAGYVKFHANLEQESEDGVRANLDCVGTDGNVARYPLHLRVASSPTDSMPAPRTVVPVPKGSTVLPALTEAEAQQLSSEELIGRGYPRRPDAASDPDVYQSWLKSVSRPSTHLPAHLVANPEISHSRGVEAGVFDSYNWSGYVADGPNDNTYISVHGEWNVPELVACDPGQNTYSAFWVGLDGYSLSDLVQAGTEQNCYDISGRGYFSVYSAWTELVPNQSSQNTVGLSPNPGDYMFTTVWIGNSAGTRMLNGGYGWFYINDMTQGQWVEFGVALGKTHFNGKTADWIMERPLFNGKITELSDYSWDYMVNAEAVTTANKEIPYSAAHNLLQLWLYNEDINFHDNDLLSSAVPDGSQDIYFQWHDFH